MKINLKTIFTLAIGVGLAFSSCKKKEDVIEEAINNGGTPVGGGASGVQINTTLVGSIQDESGNPITGAQVSIGTTLNYTDSKGLFVFENISTNKERTYVKVSKVGYFDGSRIVNPFEGQLTKVSVTLQDNSYDGVISGTTGGSVSLPSGAKVELPANGVVVESTGVAYTGNVNVSMAYLDAGSNKIGSLAPGDMMAIDANGSNRVLTSYGMLNVELTGDAGEKLQVASGSQATVTIPTTISSAPASIPLWYFDIIDGIWKEDGDATLQGSNYVGNVSHFTIWNVDFPEVPVSISGYILDCNGAPFSGVEIEIRRQSNSAFIAGGFTDSAGFYVGSIPINEALVLNVIDPCGIVVYSANIGPYSSSQVVPVISVCNFGGVVLQGSVNNSCGAPFALIEVYDQATNTLLSPVSYTQGSFTKIICGASSSSMYVVGTSVSGAQDTISLNTLNTGINNIGILNFCDTIDKPGHIIVSWRELYSNSMLDTYSRYYNTGQTAGGNSFNPYSVIKAIRTNYGYVVFEGGDTIMKIHRKNIGSINNSSHVDYYAAMSHNSTSSFNDTSVYGRFIILKNNLPFLYLDNSHTISNSASIKISDYGNYISINNLTCSTAGGLSSALNLNCNEYSIHNSQTLNILGSLYNGNGFPNKALLVSVKAYF